MQLIGWFTTYVVTLTHSYAFTGINVSSSKLLLFYWLCFVVHSPTSSPNRPVVVLSAPAESVLMLCLLFIVLLSVTDHFRLSTHRRGQNWTWNSLPHDGCHIGAFTPLQLFHNRVKSHLFTQFFPNLVVTIGLLI